MVLELLDKQTGTKVPPALSLSSENDPSIGMQIISTPVRQKSDVAQYRAGNRIRITIPSDFVDFREAYVSFTAYIDTPGAASTYDRFCMPIRSIIQRFKVGFGSGNLSLEDIDNYGLLASYAFRSNKPSAIIYNYEEGNPTAATRAAQSIASRQYQFKPEMEFLEEVIPLHKAGMPLQLELTLADVNRCLESDGANPAYLVENVYFHYNVVQVPDSYDEMLDQKIASGGLIIPYRTWFSFMFANLVGNSAQIEVPARYKSVNRTVAYMRSAADEIDLTVDGKFTENNTNDVDQAWLKIGQRTFPAEKYDFSYDAFKYEALHRHTDLFNNRYKGRERFGDVLCAASWSNTFFGIPFDLRDDPSVDEDLFQNGVDTLTSGTATTLGIVMGAPPASAQNVYTFSQHEAALQFLPGNKVKIVAA